VFTQWPGDNQSPGHVQIYMGGGKLIQSPGNTTGHVSITSLAEDAGHVVGYGRMPSGTGAAKTAGAGWTSGLWALWVLVAANAHSKPTQRVIPLTTNNVQNVERWIHSEQGTAWTHANNPLNVAGSFSSLLDSAVESGKAIDQPNMRGIRAALAANAPTALFSGAVVHSPWASGHYQGRFDKPVQQPALNLTGSGQTVSRLTQKQIDAVLLEAAHKGGLPINDVTTHALGLLGGVELAGKAIGDLFIVPGLGARAFFDILRGHPGAVTGGGINIPNPLNPVAAVGSGLASVGKDFAGAAKILGDLGSASFWKRIGIGAAGLALIVGGLVLFIATTGPAKTVESAVTKGVA
jgi:hypothetical protein